MIRLIDINKTFNTNTSNEVRALQNINLKINNNDFVVVIGFNGSGKSSLLNCIAGSFLPDSGSIFIDDENITKLPEYKRSRLIARIFQNPTLGTAPDLSILENFRFAATRTTAKKLLIGNNSDFTFLVQEKIAKLKMGLEDKIHLPIGILSGGQRQALTLVMATMDSSKLLLLDEPTAALDPKSAIIVMEKAQEIISENNLTAIMVTHQMKDAIRYGNSLILMKEGMLDKNFNASEKGQLSIEDLIGWFS